VAVIGWFSLVTLVISFIILFFYLSNFFLHFSLPPCCFTVASSMGLWPFW